MHQENQAQLAKAREISSAEELRTERDMRFGYLTIALGTLMRPFL